MSLTQFLISFTCFTHLESGMLLIRVAKMLLSYLLAQCVAWAFYCYSKAVWTVHVSKWAIAELVTLPFFIGKNKVVMKSKKKFSFVAWCWATSVGALRNFKTGRYSLIFPELSWILKSILMKLSPSMFLTSHTICLKSVLCFNNGVQTQY